MGMCMISAVCTALSKKEKKPLEYIYNVDIDIRKNQCVTGRNALKENRDTKGISYRQTKDYIGKSI